MRKAGGRIVSAVALVLVASVAAPPRAAAQDGATLPRSGPSIPFPIPLVPDGPWWRRDVAAGRDEMIGRRIGRNELNALQVCLAYVDAQRESFAEDRDGNNLLEYAQRFRSRPGMRDGLYGETQPDAPLSPLGPLVAFPARYGDSGVMTSFNPDRSRDRITFTTAQR